MKIRKIIKRILSPLLQRAHRFYYSSERTFNISKIKLTVFPGVFPPQLVFSSKILLKFISTLNVKNKKFLDIGSGTGLLAIQAAKLGAVVTAIDINEKAVENTRLNAEKNDVQLNTLKSDLFDNLNSHTFEIVVINPPFYPSKPKNESEKAWYCGENFEYFEKLFDQLSQFHNELDEIYMILSEDCDIKTIAVKAEKKGLKMNLSLKAKKWWETNFIFKIT